MPRPAAKQFLSEHAIGPTRLLVAVSGGFDSTALLLILAGFRGDGYEIAAAHVNHHLRGRESDDDEAWVLDLCHRLSVPLTRLDGSLDPVAIGRWGVEGAARHVRERLLQEARRSAGARFIVTAHQQNDQAETILMRILTGTGIAGLQGIHPVRDDGFVRPLLAVSRSDIERFLIEAGESPRRDRMNSDPRYLRTQIRRLLDDLGSEWVPRIASLASSARELWRFVEQCLDEADSSEVTPLETRFSSLPQDPFLLRALLLRHIARLAPGVREIGAGDLDRLAVQIRSGRRVTVAGGLELTHLPSGPVLRRRLRNLDGFNSALAVGQNIELPGGTVMRVVCGAGSPCSDAGSQSFQLPSGAAASFAVRMRLPGDRLRPLGASGRRKLKDILIDRKIPIDQRDTIPILLWEGRIVWVAGVVVEHEFRLRDEPGDRYTVTLSSRLP